MTQLDEPPTEAFFRPLEICVLEIEDENESFQKIKCFRLVNLSFFGPERIDTLWLTALMSN
jgi:hypothetical protein